MKFTIGNMLWGQRSAEIVRNYAGTAQRCLYNCSRKHIHEGMCIMARTLPKQGDRGPTDHTLDTMGAMGTASVHQVQQGSSYARTAQIFVVYCARTTQPSLKNHTRSAVTEQPVQGRRLVTACGLGPPFVGLPAAYRGFLKHLHDLCTAERGTLECLIGDRVVVAFNAASTNSSHRVAAAECMIQLLRAWPDTAMASDFAMYAAAVTRDCLCGSWGPTRVLLGEAVDICAAMLQLAAARDAPYGLVDGPLYQQLQYTYVCRQVPASHNRSLCVCIYLL